ncbi:MAG: hypothetical protein LCH60_13505 [Actinobacteria bacterium]|uniref:Uncharacterized protein n=1 Tax=Phycicoccus elongatus Lp2 TaxID=1193181 RepID=N0E422_9MICO|nr:hypothetical protein [Actinomycetota bacterium]CCH69664.1 hypothetical protein BN10_300005 [Phycicoccus elongatus Lp2]
MEGGAIGEKLGWGQVIRTPEDPANPSHGAKRGTPTMGGLVSSQEQSPAISSARSRAGRPPRSPASSSSGSRSPISA